MDTDTGSHYKPIMERDKRPKKNWYNIYNEADVPLPALVKLQPLLDALRQNHDALRAQNDHTVKVGVAMENTLKPVEDGIRIEKEREAAADASEGMEFGSGADEPVGRSS